MANEAGVLLEMRGISKSFSDVKVLENVNLTLEKGRILGLVGENGAGKSTLMNVLGGVCKADAGTITIEGKQVKCGSPLDAASEGIAFVHQELNLFKNLTIAENIYITGFPGNSLGFINHELMRKKAREALKRLDEDVDVGMYIEDVSIGMCQLVEVVKAIEHSAKIIIFDEPTTSLSNSEKTKLLNVIKGLAYNGVGIIYISHVLEDVLELCDSVAVLRDGSFIGEKKPPETTKSEIVEMMIGRKLSQMYPYVEKTPGEVLLEVNRLTRGKQVNDVSFKAREGEVVGMFGLMGAGRSETARAVFGIDPIDSGEVMIYGVKTEKITPEKMIEKGMAFITENRREEGLLMPKTVRNNLSLAYLNSIKGRMSYLRSKQEDADTDVVIRKLRIKTFDKNRQTVIKLSGGNQQKAVIGKWILTNPRIFILDEPTKGIDVGAKAEIYEQINVMAANKAAVIFISSEMEELMGVCDRILVMHQGRITAEIPRESFSMKAIIEPALGGER